MDKAEAVKWYQKSAEQGYKSAQSQLAVCYEFGQGVEKDQAAAAKWYQKAAEQGDVLGQRKCREHNVAWKKSSADEITLPSDESLQQLKAKADAFNDTTLVFKSMYLGMPFKDAVTVLASYLADSSKATDDMFVERYSDGMWFKDDKSGARVAADKDGNVTAFYLPKVCVEALFKSKGLEVKSFVETFQRSYSLPSFSFDINPMEAFSNNSIFGKIEGVQPIALKLGHQEKWVATSDKGFVVTIYGTPTVIEERKLMELSMGGTVSTIPTGSLVIRKIDVGAFN